MSGKLVLDGASLDAREGEVLAVMGMSGTGKSTLLKCIAGLIKPSSGHVWLGDTDMVPLGEREANRLRRCLGMVFQYAALFDSMTVAENVAFGLRHQNRGISSQEVQRVVHEKLALVGMEGTQRLMPSQLSGGMQKRVGLARALATQPEVLLYDEPTSGLDPVMARVIDDLITNLRDQLGVTSVVVSHSLESIWRISDRVAMLHGGKVIACGTPDEIKASTDPAVRQFLQASARGPLLDHAMGA
ncbi:MAG TPA: ATP-binding cassette domain-containing protein [Armatimonadota bacterium]